MRRRALVIATLALTTVAGAAEYPIAGLAPDSRPAGAPKTTVATRAAGWDARFFQGVASPRPASLAWSADQGGWYTPFDRPGMIGPYDIRNWRSKGKQK